MRDGVMPYGTLVQNRNTTKRSERRALMSESSDVSDPYGILTATGEAAANTLICLMNQGSFLLGRQSQKLEQQFLAEGCFTERLYRERRAARERDRDKR
jgi:four helix bundle suffix protein